MLRMTAMMQHVSQEPAVKWRKVSPLGLGARKNGRASAWAFSSYWAAMEATLRLRGASL